MKKIGLVHGGFVDGAGWESVYKILKKDRYRANLSPKLETTDEK